MQSKRAQAYQKLVERLSPKSDMAKGIFRAYWVGGRNLRARPAYQRSFFLWAEMGNAERLDRDEHLPDFYRVAADRVGRV